MNTEFIILITVIVCLVLFAVAIGAVQYMSKHGITFGSLVKAQGYVNMAKAVATAIEPFLPGYADGIINIVFRYVQEGVTRAEATYKAAMAVGSVSNDTRSAEAQTWIKAGLSMEGVTVTPDVQKLIDSVMPIFIRALPPTHAAA